MKIAKIVIMSENCEINAWSLVFFYVIGNVYKRIFSSACNIQWEPNNPEIGRRLLDSTSQVMAVNS